MVATASFRANVVVAKTRYQMLKVFIILRSGERVTSFTKVNNANFSIKKNGKMKLSGKSIDILRRREKTSSQISYVLVVVLVLEAKGLYIMRMETICDVIIKEG